jgi:hypothetical protein
MCHITSVITLYWFCVIHVIQNWARVTTACLYNASNIYVKKISLHRTFVHWNNDSNIGIRQLSLNHQFYTGAIVHFYNHFTGRYLSLVSILLVTSSVSYNLQSQILFEAMSTCHDLRKELQRSGLEKVLNAFPGGHAPKSVTHTTAYDSSFRRYGYEPCLTASAKIVQRTCQHRLIRGRL